MINSSCFSTGWAAECLQLCKEFSSLVVAMDIGGEENMPTDPEIIRVFQVSGVSKSGTLRLLMLGTVFLTETDFFWGGGGTMQSIGHFALAKSQG